MRNRLHRKIVWDDRFFKAHTDRKERSVIMDEMEADPQGRDEAFKQGSGRLFFFISNSDIDFRNEILTIASPEARKYLISSADYAPVLRAFGMYYTSNDRYAVTTILAYMDDEEIVRAARIFTSDYDKYRGQPEYLQPFRLLAIKELTADFNQRSPLYWEVLKVREASRMLHAEVATALGDNNLLLPPLISIVNGYIGTDRLLMPSREQYATIQSARKKSLCEKFMPCAIL